MNSENRFSGLMSGLSSSDKKAPTTAVDEIKEITETKAKSKPQAAKQIPKSKNPDYVQIGVYLPKDLHQKLKIGSAITGEEMSAIAAEGIRLWLEKNTPNI